MVVVVCPHAETGARTSARRRRNFFTLGSTIRDELGRTTL
jgi:hypothetical protein